MLKSLTNIAKILLLGSMLYVGSANSQNTVTGNINKIPTNTPAFGKVTLEDIITHDKFSTFSNSLNGNYSMPNIPSGDYKATVEVDKHHLWLDTINVNSNKTLDNKAYPYDTTQSTVLTGESILWTSKFLTNTFDTDPNHKLSRSRNVDRLWLHLNPTNGGDTQFMPSEYESKIRAVMDSITAASEGNYSYREEDSDSAGGIRFIFATNSEMPPEGVGKRALTKIFTSGLDIYRADVYINKTYLTLANITTTSFRELFVRVTGLKSNSPDIAYDTYTGGNNNESIHPDEKKVFANMFSLLVGTDMFNYRDSVCTLKELSNLDFVVNNRWNMVSLPVDSGNVMKSQVFPTATSNAYAYEGFYATKDSLKHGVGYWLKFNGSQNISVQGVLLDRDTINVIQGWNMIGSISTPIHKGQLRTIPENMSLSDLFGYSGSYDSSDSIKPGKGYWVKTNTAGKIILDKDNTITAIAFNKNEIPPSPPGVTSKESIDGFVLGQNYPNPFNNSTKVEYSIPLNSQVNIRVYNVLGQTVREINEGMKQTGRYTTNIDMNGLSSGMYLYEVKSLSTTGKTYTERKRMQLIK